MYFNCFIRRKDRGIICSFARIYDSAMKKHILLLLLLCAFLPLLLCAQKKRDTSGWLTADLILDRTRWDYMVSLEYRSKENLSRTDLFSVGQYGRYLFSDWFKVSAGYELFFTNAPEGTLLEHRLMLQNESSLRFGGLKIDNRLSLLNDFQYLDQPGWGGRDRLRVKYPVEKWEPFSYIELYLRLKGQKILHHKNRYALGLNYHPNATNLIGLYYMREQYIQKTFVNNIFGISYAMTIAI